MEDLLKALSIASIGHNQQTRKGDGGSPYINHLIEVAYLLAEYAEVSDSAVLQAVVLHDVLEDTDVSEEYLSENFDKRVVDYVRTVTDDKSQSLAKRRESQLAHMASASKEIQLIKLADLCSNVTSIPSNWEKERVLEYLQ